MRPLRDFRRNDCCRGWGQGENREEYRVGGDVWRLIREKCREKGIIVTDHNYEAISTVADQLFVLSDGYTHPVESRDDLVRHGYLLPL